MSDDENVIIVQDEDHPSEIMKEIKTEKQAIPGCSNWTLAKSEGNSPMDKKVSNVNNAVFKRPSSSMFVMVPKKMKYTDPDLDLTSILVCNFPKYYNEDKIAEFLKKSCEVLRREIFSIKIFQDVKKGSIGSFLLKLFNSTLCKKVLKIINGVRVDGRLLHATLDAGGHIEAMFNVNRSLAQKYSDFTIDADEVEVDDELLRQPDMADDVVAEEKKIFGFTEEFLNSIGVKEPLTEMITVENIPLEVADEKVGFAFALAGFIEHMDLKDGTASIEYSNPVEAIQAVSMFNGQQYYGNVLKVTMDPEPSKRSIIPDGFTNIGPGLGKFGKPLHNIAMYLLADREEKKKNYEHTDEADSVILNRIQNNLRKVKYVEGKFGIHPKRIIRFLNDILSEHAGNAPESRDPRNTASSSRSGQPTSVQGPRKMSVQCSRQTPNFPQNSGGYVSPGGNYQGPNMQPNNLNMQHPGHIHANNMTPVMSHGPVQHMGNHSPFQPKGPHAGQFQIQGPPAGHFQPQGPPSGHFQPQGPPAGQFLPQGPAGNNVQPDRPPVYVSHNNNLNVRGSPQGIGNRGPPDVDMESKKDMVIFENLPPCVTTDVLLDKVQKCGNVKFLQLMSAGTAFVRYYNRECAERCLSMFANSQVNGYVVRVRFF